ncbi:hypothetical protein [Clostridium sp. 'White wine YQ']|uniref:hypothetical protein n=1 Tax=Clostridium sp. 'White wine YQ' TaxID=3027474 RepID=UPI00236662EB|nr:hypothetical protein [Clostridium sp. 'White wine YQ']MDD7793486.1 hypothetical protein [Clostridium sp. 'White wine YQ']
MIDESKLEDDIKLILEAKTEKVKLSKEMFSNIVKRLENNKEESKFIIPRGIFRRSIAASLSGICILMFILFITSGEIRTFAYETANNIKSIFVLDKYKDGYKLAQKTTSEEVLMPTFTQSTKLNDEELSNKLGFKVVFPSSLKDGYEYYGRAESVGINKKVSDEVSEKLQGKLQKAINDENTFKDLKDYLPFRSVFGMYKDKNGNIIYLTMTSSEIKVRSDDAETSNKVELNKCDAYWIQEVEPDYTLTNEEGIFKADIHIRPENITKKHFLTWQYRGVNYYLNTYKAEEIKLEDAVKMANSFMEQQ